MPKNYTIYHCHSTVSNLSGAGMDSVTGYKDYINAAKECGMTAFGFSEHGNFYLYKKKKDYIESNGMKYLHGIEAYLTENIDETVRDNYHVVLIAKNYDGFKELNTLQSHAFERDGHYYYAPRITFNELCNTSDNVICTSACIGSVLGKGNDVLKEKFIQFLSEHKDRCFLEIQHHNVEKQKQYNLYLLELHNKYGIPLIAGTDTHCLNKEHEDARKIMQAAKHVVFNDDEAGWDLTFKTYDQLVAAYELQNCLPEEVYLEAIENTNIMADMVEPIIFDTSFKYPKIYDNSKEKLHKMIFNEQAVQSIVDEGYTKEEVLDRLQEEYDTFVAVDAVDYILLIKYIADWAHSNDMWQGPARGSAASSLALYELGVTEVNPLKHGFKFWRFMHKDKYSAADVDTDWAEKDRDRLKEWMLVDKLNLPKIQTAEIITFNTIALKGAIRDVGRGLDIPNDEVDEIAKAVKEVNEEENKIVTIDQEWRDKYPELFKYVDLVQGVFVSVGSHPSGVLVTDEDLAAEIGYCHIKGDEYPVSVLDMVELDSRNFVKEDILGLDNVSIINETCKLAGIQKVSPKTINLEDDKIWDSIKNDTTLLFQINSNYGRRTVNKMFARNIWDKVKRNVQSITRFDLLCFISALIRPCGKSVYPITTEGNAKKSGIKDIDDLLAPEMGYPLMQETQMEFVQKFCGYSFLEADMLRKSVAKKRKTRDQLPKIKKGFEENAKIKYNLTKEQSDNIIDSFNQCILDATRYSYSKIHCYSYTYISYESAYLRTYYPLEYLTACFNTYIDKPDKVTEVTEYCKRNNIKINPPKFRYSKSEYFFDKDTNSIYKGTRSVKYLNDGVANKLYELRDRKYSSFVELLYDLKDIDIDSRQLEILIKLDYFSEFGNSKELLRLVLFFNFFKKGEMKSVSKEKLEGSDAIRTIVAQHSTETPKKYKDLDNKEILKEVEEYVRSLNIEDFGFKDKIQSQLEYTGYISLITGKKEDKPKEVALNVKTMYSKDGDRKPWAVVIQGQSIGSGVKNDFTIPYNKFSHHPFSKYDIIHIKKFHKSPKGYWYIDSYEVLI